MGTLSRNEDWQARGARGFELYESGQFEAARRELDIVVAAGPPRDMLAKVHFQRGLCSAKLGNMRAAADAYRAAVKIDPAMRDAHFNLGKALAEQAQYREAIAAYTQAIETDRRWGPAYCNRADARIQLAAAESDVDGFERAVSDLDRALAANEMDYLALFNRALALQHLGRPHEGVTNLKVFLALSGSAHPHRARAQQLLAEIEATPVEQPVSTVKQPVSPAMQRRRQKRIPADLARIDELIERKSYEEACKLCRSFLEMAESPEAMPIAVREVALPMVYGNLGHALLMTERYAEALQVCEEGLAACPRSPQIWRLKGNILGHIGRYEESTGALERFIAFAEPEHAELVERTKKVIEWNQQKLREEGGGSAGQVVTLRKCRPGLFGCTSPVGARSLEWSIRNSLPAGSEPIIQVMPEQYQKFPNPRQFMEIITTDMSHLGNRHVALLHWVSEGWLFLRQAPVLEAISKGIFSPMAGQRKLVKALKKLGYQAVDVEIEGP